MRGAPDPPDERSARVRVRAAKVRASTTAKHLAERAQAERSHHRSLDATFEVVDHDAEIGGGIMAGALAYRLFIWLLPLAHSSRSPACRFRRRRRGSSSSPRQAAKSMGLAGLVSSSVAGSAKSSARWYALFVGVPLLLYATRSVLRALLVTHRLIWEDARGSVRKPNLRATAGSSSPHSSASSSSPASRMPPGMKAAAAARSSRCAVCSIPYAALWLFVSLRLPHAQAGWRDLIPGSLLFAVGAEALHLFTAYVIGPQAASKEGTYGALGVAAALLLGLFLLSRLAIASAVMNATLWRRRMRRRGDTAP